MSWSVSAGMPRGRGSTACVVISVSTNRPSQAPPTNRQLERRASTRACTLCDPLGSRTPVVPRGRADIANTALREAHEAVATVMSMGKDPTDGSGAARTYQSLLDRAARNDVLTVPEIGAVIAELEEEVFGAPPRYTGRRTDVNSDAELVTFILDLALAQSLIEPNDSALPWNRGAIVSALGHYAAAARDFTEAARLAREEHATGTGVTGEEDETAYWSLYHAARNLAEAKHTISAALLAQQLRNEERNEILVLLDLETSK